MRETCARVLAAALMTGAIAFALGAPALFESPRDEGRPLTAPPSSLQRSVRVPALPASVRPHRAERPVSALSTRRPAASPVVDNTPRSTRPRPRRLTPKVAGPARPTAEPAPATETRELASATPQPVVPAPAPQPVPAADADEGKGKPKGKAKGHSGPKLPPEDEAEAVASPEPIAPAAPATESCDPPGNADEEHGNGKGNGRGNANGHDK